MFWGISDLFVFEISKKVGPRVITFFDSSLGQINLDIPQSIMIKDPFHCTQATKHASEGSALALKPRGDVTRSIKTGVSVAPRKGLMSSKSFKKRIHSQVFGLVDSDQVTWPLPPSLRASAQRLGGKARSQGLESNQAKIGEGRSYSNPRKRFNSKDPLVSWEFAF